MKKYTTKALSSIAAVSVRTLHYYDTIGVLKSAIRTEAGYRLYGKNELLRLQQILFYKELGFSLKEIVNILDAPDFDLIEALKHHKQALQSEKKRISVMLDTVDKTIVNLKSKTMITNEELYQGFSAKQRNKIREEAIEKYGEKNLENGENSLKKLSKQEFETLKKEQKDVFKTLFLLAHQEPKSEVVQLEIARHYNNTLRFWGVNTSIESQKEKYIGLAELYRTDSRFTKMDEKVQPEFAEFLAKAMIHFAITQLA